MSDHDPLQEAPSGNIGEDEVVAAGLANAESDTNPDPIEHLRSLMRYLIDNLLDDPQEVEMTLEQRGQLVAIQVRVPEDDLGKLIGRGGRIAKAMRAALMIAGSRHHVRVSLDIES